MSRENVELVRELLSGFSVHGHQPAFEIYDPDIEWDASRVPAPDLAAVYHGHEGVREFWRSWLAAWDAITLEAVEIVDAGDDVLAFIEQHNRGRATRIEVEMSYALVFTFGAGKLIRWCYYPDRREALEAVGLSE